MKQVFHLNIQWGDRNSDLYFEDQDTADRTATFLTEAMAKKSGVEIKITPTIEKVLSREDTIENILKGLNMAGMFGRN